MSSSCRGIIIAGVTNRARTQMAEGILRYATGSALFVKSGGIHHEATVHPLAVKVMREIGIDISGQVVSSLTSAQRQHNTYDVYVSIDSSYDRKLTNKSQRPANDIYYNSMESDEGHFSGEEECCYDPMLVPRTPAHWAIGADSTDAQRRWRLWSPRDPTIFHETSTRKFQDHLYEGEPLFMQLETTYMRTQMKISERWEMDEIATRYVVERDQEHENRFIAAREDLLRRCAALLTRLEEYYGEQLIVKREFMETHAAQ